jgi:hypothetical protein
MSLMSRAAGRQDAPTGARCSRRQREWLVHAGESTKGTGHRAQGILRIRRAC